MILKKTILFFLSIFLLCCIHCFSQDIKKVNELTSKISSCKDDTNKVKLLEDIAKLYSGNDEDKTHKYLEQALTLSKKLDYKKGSAKALSMIASHYYRTAVYIEAILTSIKAVTYYYEMNDLDGIASSYNNIGNIYFQLEKYNEALKYQEKALDIQQKLKDKRDIASTMNNIGSIYQATHDLSKAQYYFESALKIQKSINGEVNMAKTYNNMGTLFDSRNDYSKALEYFLMSEKIYEGRENKRGLAITLCHIANVYLHEKKYTTAVEYFQKSLTLAEKSEAREVQEDAYEGLASSYENLNLLANALKYYKLYNITEDSIVDVGKQQLVGLQNKFESEKRENLINLQKSELKEEDLKIEKQLTQLYALSGGVFLLITLSIIIYRGYKRKKKDNHTILIEKKRSDDLLLNILPNEIAEELKQNGKSQAKKIDMVTVLFADFKEFSKHAEILDAEKLVEELDYYFRSFDTIIGKYDIEKIKTIGDAYMCAGGVPGVNSSNPWDVVNCGSEMRDFVLQNKKKQQEANKPILEMRIGIHTGPVVAGIVGIKKFSYDIWGDTVNIASRLESGGKEGKVNISESTYQYVKDLFQCEYRGKIPAKNIGEIDMYFAEPLKKV